MADLKSRTYYLPPGVSMPEIYHESWIDFNKNGVMDPYENPKLPVEERVEDLLSRMTLEEKVAQLQSGRGIGRHGIGNLTHVTRDLPPREGAVKANELQIRAIEGTRLGVPVIIHDECLHGCMAYHSTSFPQAIALAATWDPNLVYRVAKAIARETRARGIHQCLSPVVNIVRDVRAGRTEESFGEDPYLASAMGAAFCRALREEGVIATPKHFVANFVGDGGRDSHEIHFSERILREVYFPAFMACIKAGALSVMAAYNSLDGVPCSSNKWLLTEVLKEEWGFEGFVVSDYGSIAGIMHKHYVASSPEEVAMLALEAGLDVELPRTEFYGEPLLRAVREGLVSEEVLDEAVRRVLRAKFLIGLFDSPFADPDEAERVCCCEEHMRLALEAARKSIVLLKNEDGLLPLDRGKLRAVAVIGELAKCPKLGGYSGVPPRVVSPLNAIREKAGPSVKVLYAEGCSVTLEDYYPIAPKFLRPPEGSGEGLRGEYFSNAELSGAPAVVRVDSAVYFDWGEGSPDPKLPPGNFSVRWVGKLIAPETGVYVVYVTASGGVRLWLGGRLLVDAWYDRRLATESAVVKLEGGREYDVKLEYFKRGPGPAVVKLGWDYDGELPECIKKAVEVAREADVAIVFAGIVEGEGRDRARLELPGLQEKLIEEVLKTGTPTVVVLMTGSAVTGRWLEKVPAVLQAWYPGQEGGTAIAEVLFGECCPGGKLPFTWPRHVGQLPLYYNYKPSGRGYDYVDMPGTPLFPFGHGLSYTEFRYDDLRIEVDEARGLVRVSVDVENVGSVEGDEVVQLYLRDVVSSVARPLKELRGFKRVTLKPGERTTVTFELTPDDLAFFDAEMRRVVEPGDFEVMVGSSSEDIRLRGTFRINRELRAKFDVTGFEVRDGESGLEVLVTVKNVGLVSDAALVRVAVDGEEACRRRVWLSPGESRRVRVRVGKPRSEVSRIEVGVPEPRLEAKLVR